MTLPVSRAAILVVDDEPIVRKLLVQVLRADDVELVQCGSVAEAHAALAARAEFDVALIDKNLPDGTGMELCRDIRQSHPDTELIVITGYPSLDTALEAFDVDVFDYVLKPFQDIKELALKVRNAREKVRLSRERARLFRELEESEARYRVLFDATPDAVWLKKGEEEKIVAANAAASALCGVSDGDLIGRSAGEFLRSAASMGESGAVHDTVLRPGGEQRWVEVSRRDVTLSGEPATIEVLRDVTAKREAEIQKRALEAQLVKSQQMELVGQLAAGVAHDFNNLIVVFLNYAGFVEERLDPSIVLEPKVVAELKDDVHQIRVAGESASRLTRQLLLLSRSPLAIEDTVDINEIVRDMQRLLGRTLGADVEILVDLADGLPRMRCDRGQLEQVLLNLAVNARDAMESGGKLKIATKIEPRAEQPWITVSVSDTGVGMDSALQSRIFEPLFTTKDPGRGTGLGLFTVRSIVESRGGKIAVDSTPGVGTTFTCAFPAAPADAQAISQQPMLKRSRGGETVLLVEDDGQVREVMRRVLKEAGYRVLDARRGEEALDVVKRSGAAIQLLVTDVVLPGMSGPELSERIGKSRSSLKTLFVSGYGNEAIERKGAVKSADSGSNILAKPFTEDQLLRAVRVLLDG